MNSSSFSFSSAAFLLLLLLAASSLLASSSASESTSSPFDSTSCARTIPRASSCFRKRENSRAMRWLERRAEESRAWRPSKFFFFFNFDFLTG